MVYALISILALELFSFILSKSRLLLINARPAIYSKDSKNFSKGIAWRTENSAWGAWHKNNFSDTHQSECINAAYQSNEIGARDESFQNLSKKKTYILLGDSFAEGYGVNKNKTSEFLLEEKLDINILNFGSAGGMGPLQYSILYADLAKKYNHDEVIIYFLPANDFTDNDYSLWKSQGWTYINSHVDYERYRPYYEKNESGYRVFYPDNSIKRDDFQDKSMSNLRNFLSTYFWSSNVFRTAELIYLQFKGGAVKKIVQPKDYSGYFDATEDQQKAAIFYLKQLIESTSKKVTLVVIPEKNDILRINGGGDFKKQLWYSELKKMTQINQLNLVDLSQYVPIDFQNIYFSCDGHWSEYGNRWAADVLVNHLKR
jgi:hypothetical protein